MESVVVTPVVTTDISADLSPEAATELVQDTVTEITETLGETLEPTLGLTNVDVTDVIPDEILDGLDDSVDTLLGGLLSGLTPGLLGEAPLDAGGMEIAGHDTVMADLLSDEDVFGLDAALGDLGDALGGAGSGDSFADLMSGDALTGSLVDTGLIPEDATDIALFTPDPEIDSLLNDILAPALKRSTARRPSSTRSWVV